MHGTWAFERQVATFVYAATDSPFSFESVILRRIVDLGAQEVGMTIARIIERRGSHEVISCEAFTAMRDAVALLAEKRIGALPVMHGGNVVGIFSERDVIYRLAHEGEICLKRPLEEVMTAPPITVEPTTPIDEALALMTRRRIRHLPVIDGTAMVGFISIGDLVKHRIDQVEHEAEALRNYIQTA